MLTTTELYNRASLFVELFDTVQDDRLKLYFTVRRELAVRYYQRAIRLNPSPIDEIGLSPASDHRSLNQMQTSLLTSMLAAGLITPAGATGTLSSLLAAGLLSELSYMTAEQAELALSIEVAQVDRQGLAGPAS